MYGGGGDEDELISSEGLMHAVDMCTLAECEFTSEEETEVEEEETCSISRGVKQTSRRGLYRTGRIRVFAYAKRGRQRSGSFVSRDCV